jgi:hypothetical protein
LTLNQLLKHEETLWRSKSREIWLTCKDLNTKYFHTFTLIRRRSNDINFLKLDYGAWISFKADIGRQFLDYFSKLFSNSNPTVEVDMLNLFSEVVTVEDNSLFYFIPTELEVIQALASLGSSKSPGLDGFTTLFYKKYWSLIKIDVLNFIWNFFKFHHLPREQNHTFLALIPKVNGSHLAHQFKPISLCNIVYKIISKLLANRLKPLLHKISNQPKLLSSTIRISKITQSLLMNFYTPLIIRKAKGFFISKNGHGKGL